jgi:hypothetical protein
MVVGLQPLVGFRAGFRLGSTALPEPWDTWS